MCELWFTNKKVIGVHVDPPYIDIARSVYTNAFEFGSRDFATGGISQPSNFPPNRTYGAGRTGVGLCPKFLVFLIVIWTSSCCL